MDKVAVWALIGPLALALFIKSASSETIMVRAFGPTFLSDGPGFDQDVFSPKHRTDSPHANDKGLEDPPVTRRFEQGHRPRFMTAESDLSVAVTLELFGRDMIALPITDVTGASGNR